MMDCKIMWIITITAIFVAHPVSATLGVTLNSSLNEALTVYDQQEVIFTCTVRGTSNVILEWSSVEYIGQGGFPLQLLSLNGTGTNVSSTTNPSTYAVRRSVSTENNQTVILSDLRLVASLQYPMGTVSCSASANGASFSESITFITRDFPSQVTEGVISNNTTMSASYQISTTAPTTIAAIEDLTNSMPENQRICTCNRTHEISLAVFLAISILVIFIQILIIAIFIIKVRSKNSSRVHRGFEPTTPTRDSPVHIPIKTDNSETPGAAPKPKLSDASPEKEGKQKKGFLGALHGTIKQFGLDACLNNKEYVESEETVLAALTALYEALRDGQYSKFKDAIEYLCDDLPLKKVPDAVLNRSLEKIRENNSKLHSQTG